MSLLRRGDENRRGDAQHHSAYCASQAENLQRHGRSGSRHEGTGQPARLDFSPIDGSAKACLGAAGEKIPGGGEEGQGDAGHGKADSGFRFGLRTFTAEIAEYAEKINSCCPFPPLVADVNDTTYSSRASWGSGFPPNS